MATLTVRQGGDLGKQFELDEGESVIGRSPECDVVLDVAAVSRRHAIISYVGDQFWINDTGSRNGTIVNGQRVVGKAQLRDGDRILICDVEFEFRHLPPTGILGGAPAASSLLSPLMPVDQGDDEEDEATSIMATIDV
ncbi:MAG TPA: FHA domain-containing protein, partial [Lacipirellulaceae bacterium]|nr:FHA domain-containing protein [Lacipirellulaceae bacterium]